MVGKKRTQIRVRGKNWPDRAAGRAGGDGGPLGGPLLACLAGLRGQKSAETHRAGPVTAAASVKRPSFE